jgi:cbb3-type cytochrome oxidase subunit 3
MDLALAAAMVRATMLLIVIGVVAWLLSKGVKAMGADSSTPPFGLRSE